MNAALQGFFAAIAPMLRSQRSAAETERTLGPSPSGTAALAFYGELVARNYRKILRDVFACTAALARVDDAPRWHALVEGYLREHVASGNDPNGYAAAFVAWLQSHAAPQLWIELADFEWLRVLAHHARDGDDDGFERRLFVRQYSRDVPAFFRARSRDASVPVPAELPCVVVVFRHVRTLQVRVAYPRAAGLAALARRQGLALPQTFAAIEPAAIDEAERALVQSGVLTMIDEHGGES